MTPDERSLVLPQPSLPQTQFFFSSVIYMCLSLSPLQTMLRSKNSVLFIATFPAPRTAPAHSEPKPTSYSMMKQRQSDYSNKKQNKTEYKSLINETYEGTTRMFSYDKLSYQKKIRMKQCFDQVLYVFQNTICQLPNW